MTKGGKWTPPSRRPVRLHAGADWLEGDAELKGKPLHPEARWVLDMLGEFAGGLYNFHGSLIWDSTKWGQPEPKQDGLKATAAQWTRRGGYRVLMGCHLSTWDNNLLTRLVFLAHDWGVRVEITPHTPRHFLVYLNVRPRTRLPGMSVWGWHPRLGETVRNWVESRHHWK